MTLVHVRNQRFAEPFLSEALCAKSSKVEKEATVFKLIEKCFLASLSMIECIIIRLQIRDETGCRIHCMTEPTATKNRRQLKKKTFLKQKQQLEQPKFSFIVH